MKRSQIRAILETGFTTLLISSLLLVSAACNVPSESDIIEGILENVDEMNGEMTIVTKDGETITIRITTGGEEDEESPELSELEVGSVVKVDADRVTQVEKTTEQKPITDTNLSDILPPLNGYEDVFYALGVLEDAKALREKGLSWEHVARELGYTADSMHLRLQDIGEEYLKAARDSGLITQEQLEYKFECFSELAMKWVKEIFADIDTTTEQKPSTSAVSISDILPPLNSIEDVFRALGVLEDAIAFREKGLTWEHIARELGYGPDSMHLRLQDIGEEYLKAARDSGLITQEQLEHKFEYFNELALKWVKEIFADTNTTTDEEPLITTISISDILPPLNSIEDVFRALGVLEDAIAFREKGLTWEHIARELDYTADSMYFRLQNIGEEYLRKAKESGLINHEQFEYKFEYFSELAMKWVKEIFGDTDNTTDEKPSTDTNLSDILPPLNSIEDVFRALGVLEDAAALCEEGLTWEHIARELDYTAVSMYLRLQDIGEDYLREAKESGLITHEQFEYKFEYFNELALKWVIEIFGDDI